MRHTSYLSARQWLKRTVQQLSFVKRRQFANLSSPNREAVEQMPFQLIYL